MGLYILFLRMYKLVVLRRKQHMYVSKCYALFLPLYSISITYLNLFDAKTIFHEHSNSSTCHIIWFNRLMHSDSENWYLIRIFILYLVTDCIINGLHYLLKEIGKIFDGNKNQKAWQKNTVLTVYTYILSCTSAITLRNHLYSSLIYKFYTA